MTLDELKLRHSALLAARYSGTQSVSYDGPHRPRTAWALTTTKENYRIPPLAA